ncbi:MAG: hypothetical protein H0T79_18590 [Deltaproteobacteria bacterium]|nr:hypothetical protein [Deltaproteobacteria bacterium]
MTDAAFAPSPLTTRRPGGLTALAVLNIVFALLGMLSGVALHMMNKDRHDFDRQADQMDRAADHMRFEDTGGGGANPEMSRAMAKGMAMQMRSSSPEAFRYMFWTGMLGGVLLLVSGVGLLAQKRFMGRHLAIAATVSLFVCGAVAMMKLGFIFWGFPMLGAGYTIVMALLVHFAYRPATQR